MTFPFIFISRQERERPMLSALGQCGKKKEGIFKWDPPPKFGVISCKYFCDVFCSSLRYDRIRYL